MKSRIHEVDQLPFVGRYYEVLLAHLYRHVLRNGGDAIDGGANSGLHTIGMGRALGEKDGMIISVEPQADLVEAGKKWISSAKLGAKTRCHICALSDKIGSASFFVDHSNKALSSLRTIGDSSKKTKITVPTETIDNLCQNVKPAFIKLDLEGGEYSALIGGRETIKKHKPIIVFENSIRGSARAFHYHETAIYRFFFDIDYTVKTFYGQILTDDASKLRPASFMFIATPNSPHTAHHADRVVDNFWENVAPTLDLSEWDMTVKATIQAAKESGYEKDGSAGT